MRYFHNFYGIFQLSKSVGLILGLDYGLEEKPEGLSGDNTWICPIAIARFSLSDKAALSVRAEYYDDENGVIIATGTPNGFKTTGISANFDYLVSPNVMWRFEVRNFSSKDEVFVKEDGTSKSNTFVATSLAISF
jgi:hypothetical protein